MGIIFCEKVLAERLWLMPGTGAVRENLILCLSCSRQRCVSKRGWMLGKPGRPPKSILEALTGTGSGSDTEDVQSFASPEEFEAAIAALKGG